MKALLMLLLLTGCTPSCFQFNIQHDCAVIDPGRPMIPGGMRDAEAFAKHFAYGREGKDSPLPGMFLGAITVAIGSFMLLDGGKKLWAEHVKERAAAKAATPHTERVKRSHEHAEGHEK